ncbi:MAG: DUF362 domain-containing protein [Bacteroidetes bacterium]|nr:DUF362 domain-containing protein [Bacteroidota bacterium]MCL5025176.1 DUF362 domain-containing protein [Chloroflexota bacterium]
MTNRPSRVALTRGESRYDNVRRALELVQDDIDLRGKRRVVIKPNLVSVRRQLASTHVNAVRAVLDFVRERYRGKLVIAERPETGTAAEAFRNFRYADLPRRYDVELVDLSDGGALDCQAVDAELKPLTLRVSRYLAESDYRISVNPPKNHDFVLVTLSAKNMAVGSLVKDDRGNDRKRFHQGYPGINLNLYRVVRLVYPHLAVIDGYEGMDGDGPVNGDPVPLRVALASTDFVAADAVTASVMGYDPSQVGYLTYCQKGGLGMADLSRIQVVGDPLTECRRPFRHHPDYAVQLQWQIEGVERYL